jgi:hypothetical protein
MDTSFTAVNISYINLGVTSIRVFNNSPICLHYSSDVSLMCSGMTTVCLILHLFHQIASFFFVSPPN